MPKGAVNADGTAIVSNGHSADISCGMAGCIKHEQAEFDTDGFTYTFVAHFTTMDELVECAVKEVARRCQLTARKKEFPRDRVVDVDYKGKFALTLAEKNAQAKAEFDAMSKEKQDAYIQMLLNK